MKTELIGSLVGMTMNLVVLFAAIEIAKYGWGKKVVTNFKQPWQEDLWFKALPLMKWVGSYLIIQQVIITVIFIMMIWRGAS